MSIFNKNIKEIIYGIYIFFLFCGGGFLYKNKKLKQPKGNILLIPGFLVNSLGFRPMASYLNKQGYNVYLPGLGWNIYDFDDEVDNLNNFWEKQKIKSELPLYIIGHSMGGLIAHAWINKYKIHPTNLITLGTPFLGSKVVSKGLWCHFPAAKALQKKDKPSKNIPKLVPCEEINLAAKGDHLVRIQSSLCKDIKSKKILLKNIGGHSGLQVNPKMFEIILDLID